MTVTNKAANLISPAGGLSSIGLSSYQWWSEGLHGVANSPGVTFQTPNGSIFSYATSFPMPILMAAAFDDDLISKVATVIGKEARAFANAGMAGFDFWTPNINGFLDPRWGRGLETPGEDMFRIQNYVKHLVPGLQGVDDKDSVKQVIATCKHYAVYDVESNRYGENYDVTQRDLGDYYLPAFKTCVRDAFATSIMCSYNAVDGVPSCASEYLLQTLLRDTWNFTADNNYVVSDCDAVENIYDAHNFTSTVEGAAAVALNAGTDLNCNGAYKNLVESVAENMTTEATLDRSLTRLYHALFSVGYFDGAEAWDGLSWADVGTESAQAFAYQVAVEGMTLLKNDGTLPLDVAAFSSVALIGPWANATTQMQGNYYGVAPYLISPLQAFKDTFKSVLYAQGTSISGSDDTGFLAAITAAQSSDIIVYMGGIDTTVEAEGRDRSSVAWTGNQLDLISELGALGKSLIVVQFGGGQLDDTALLQNPNVSGIVWAGYPGQNGGNALLDVLSGAKSIAGRLPVTQYPANYTSQVSIFNPALRPNATFPGRTYTWYTGDAVLPFGYGLHYTNFTFSWMSTPQSTYSIQSLIEKNSREGAGYLENARFATLSITVKNIGGHANLASDYVGLLFISPSSDAGPPPIPKKSLISYARASAIPVNQEQVLDLPITLGSLARADENGSLTIYPGEYKVTLDTGAELTASFRLTGKAAIIDVLPPQAAEYNYTVPVYPQA
jgi:beta-D-xylosidase 4